MKQKDKEYIIDYLKNLKQAKDILETHVGKYILGHYVDSLYESKNARESEDKQKIK